MLPCLRHAASVELQSRQVRLSPGAKRSSQGTVSYRGLFRLSDPQPRCITVKANGSGSTATRSADDVCEEVPMGTSHFMAGPLSTCSAPKEGAALLVILPGALLGPRDYHGLLRALQNEAADSVSLWVAAAYPTWQNVDWADQHMQEQGYDTMMDAVDAIRNVALRQGFSPQQLRSGRWENMFIVSHSSATQFASEVAMRYAGGLILLGSYLFPLANSWSSLYEWSRPVLHLGGMQDGQVRQTRLALPALQSADVAARSGTRYAAAFKPVILLPGVNHGSMSNGQVRRQAGDFEADISAEEARQSIAHAIITFLLAHGGLDDDIGKEACAHLERECRRTAHYLSPFTEALGRGSIAQPWAPSSSSNGAGRARQYDSAAASDAGSSYSTAALAESRMLSYSHGAEMLPDADSSRRFLAHPAEMANIEAFAIRLQWRIILASDLEEKLRDKRVIVTVHTDMEAFIYSQPLTTSDWIMVQAFLHRPNLVPYGHRIPIAPQYFFKLKSGAGLREVYDLQSQRGREIGISAAELHREALDAALDRVTPDARANFEARGKFWDCAPDRDVTHEMTSAVQWVKDMHIELRDVGRRTTRVTSPIAVPVVQGQQQEQHNSSNRRFTGSIYLKCMSLAGAVEWILCDGLRPSTYADSADH